eukprot:1795912-Pleurochrysis_carterae.AAC.1
MARATPVRPRSPGRGRRCGRRWPLARRPDPISREGRESARPGAGGPVMEPERDQASASSSLYMRQKRQSSTAQGLSETHL